MHLSWLLCLLPLASAELLPRGNSSSSSTPDASTKASSSSSSTIESTTTSSKPSTITSSASITSKTATGDACGTCSFGPGQRVEWEWPEAEIENVTVATIIYRINTINNVTQTITSLATMTATAENDAAGWNSVLNTTGVTMNNGSPVITKVFTVYTEADKYYTTSIPLQSPAEYDNWGWLVETAGSESQSFTTTVSDIVSTGSTCARRDATIAFTPSAPLAGETALFQGIVDGDEWFSMVPDYIKETCSRTMVSPAGVVSMQSALTATTTEYDDTVHSQTSSTKASAAPDSTKKESTSGKESATKDTKTSTAKVSTKEETSAAPASTKQSSAAPASSRSKSAASQQSQASQPASSQPAASQPTTAASPASSAIPTTATITHVSTIASTGTSTVTPVVIASSTFLPGSIAVISSTTYSLQVTTSGYSTLTNLIANGQTLSTTSTAGYGSLIYAGLGSTVTASEGSATVTTRTSVVGTETSVEVATFTGGAATRRREVAAAGFAVVVGVVAVLL